MGVVRVVPVSHSWRRMASDSWGLHEASVCVLRFERGGAAGIP
jgi:hypothetical protein